MMVLLDVHATSSLKTGAHFSGTGTSSMTSRTSSASMVLLHDSFSLLVAYEAVSTLEYLKTSSNHDS